jgi:hypothetical protein
MSRAQAQARHEFQQICVFTGDLVGSSRLSPEDLSRAMEQVDLAYEDVRRLHRPDHARYVPKPAAGWEPGLSHFRGDGWQCIGPAPALALRGALMVRARLGSLGRAFDTRISIGIGSGRVADDLDMAAGPAFELSGRGLDTMAHARRFALAWERPPENARLVGAMFDLADEISRNWTPGQARVFVHLLAAVERPNQETLAASLGVTQQTVAGHLSGGGDWALQEALQALEERNDAELQVC